MRSTILIVGPSRELLQTLSDKLPADHAVYMARTLAAGLSIIGCQPVHLVLLAPDGLVDGGRMWCLRLKETEGERARPVIMVTAAEGLEVRQRCLAAGADEHMGGTVFREHLDMLVRHWLATRSKVKSPAVDAIWGRKPPVLSAQEELLQKLHACLADQASCRDLSVDQLARLMHMSRPTLYRKLKLVTSLTPNELINEIKLKQAAALLAQGNYRVFEVAQLLGYTSQSSFGKSFLKYYKMTPASYQRMKKMQQAA